MGKRIEERYYIIKLCCFECKRFIDFYIIDCNYKKFFETLEMIEIEDKEGAYIVYDEYMKEIERKMIYD